jgi:competence protein ComFB
MFSKIHNVIEDLVFNQVTDICDAIGKTDSGEFCTCPQCRSDTACYVLNRVSPRYIVSHRGITRVEPASLEYQQNLVDITALVYEGLRRVGHNQRNTGHHDRKDALDVNGNVPVFNIPTVVGRLFNGVNFEPLAGVAVELRFNGELVQMKDDDWQNPYGLVANTKGTFAFWPQPIPANASGQRGGFEYSIRVEVPGLETLNHFFRIPVISDTVPVKSYSIARTFKLPDLYMFPPGGDENIRIAE